MPSIPDNFGGSMQRPSMSWKQGPFGGRVNPETASRIRAMILDGYLQKDIAEKFGVSQQLISRFKLGYRKT